MAKDHEISPYKYIPQEEETIREKKARRQRFVDLGWEEKEHENWYCVQCQQPRFTVVCHACGKCEACSEGVCQGDSQ